MSTDLPVISRPTSPEFPSIVRSRASSSCPPLAAPLLPQVNQTLQKQKGKLASSCPQLPSAETKGQRILRREQEEEKFLARQLQHSGLQTRRQRSIVQREYLQRSRDADDIEFLGAKGKDGFRTFLQKKFGSILKGWRAIDSDNSGRLGFHEFCHACRAVGFHGNFKKLWSELDVKQSGTVSLMEVDSEVGKYIRTFKVALMKRYGDLATAWFQCIDVSKDGQCMSKIDGIGGLGWALGLLLRFGFALCPHSGQGKPPMFGDYEAQRHWMELTTALPLLQWYEPTADNDLQYWGLDYPPLMAFHSWLLGTIGHQVDPTCFALHTSRGHESLQCKAFLRSSVMVSDLLIYLPGAVYAAKSFAEAWQPLALFLWLLPPLVIIDHGHFQYNCVCLGLSLAAAGCVAQKRIVPASVLFTLALLYKQISLYYAPAFFFGILSQCLRPFAFDRAVLGVASAGAAVICTILLLFGPWLLTQQPLPAVLQVLHRMFPFARGLYEDKVANFWCSISVVFKVQRLVPTGRLPLLCASTTLVSLLPSAFCTLRRKAGPGAFAAALFTSSMSFFLFAFQVHEKGVLFPSLAVCLLPPALAKEWRQWRPLRSSAGIPWILAVHFQLVSLFSMYPLMVKDDLCPAYFLSILCLLAVLIVLCERSPNPPNTACRSLLLVTVLVGVLLHFLHAVVPPPQRYPDIWTLLITGVSCGYFMLALILVTIAQLYGAFDADKMHQKDAKDA